MSQRFRIYLIFFPVIVVAAAMFFYAWPFFDVGNAHNKSVVQNTSSKEANSNEASTSSRKALADFENETLGALVVHNWSFTVENDASAEFKVVDGGVGNTGKALQITIDALGLGKFWDIQMVREGVQVQPQAIYNYSAWVKGTKEAEVRFAVESSDYVTLGNRKVILTGEWQQVAFEFISVKPSVRTPIHFSFPYSFGATVLVDEVRVEPSL